MREIFRLVGKIALDGTVELDEKLKAIDKQAGKVGASLNKMGKDLTKIGMELTKNVTVPIAAAAVALYKGIELASDLAEVTSKTGEIFGSSAAQIEQWANTAATSMGQSKTQAMDAASTFAIFGKSAGLAGADLVGFSTQFAGLASDLASFNNTTPEQAIVAIGAAMRGEMEPIRQYGVLLDDASLRQKALELGIIDSVKNALTPQQKVLASSALIMEQTATAQGDFARTSDGLANQQRILKAEITNTAAELGEAFLPIAKDVVGILRDNFLPVLKGVAQGFKNLSPEMRESIVILAALAAAFGPVLMIVGKMSGVIGVLIPLISKLVMGQLTLNAAMTANPIGVIIAALTALIAIGILVWKNWDAIKGGMLSAWDAIVYGVQQAISYLKILFLSYIKMWVDGINIVGQYIPGLNNVLDTVRNKMQELIDAEKESIKYKREARKESIEEAKALKEQEAALKNAKIANAEANEVKKEDVKITGEQIAAAKKLKEEREKFETDWTAKLFQETATRTEILEAEKQAALLKAEELGANKQAILDYYKALEDQKVLDWQTKAAEAKMTEDELILAEMERELQQVGENEAAKQAIRDYYMTKQAENQKKAYETQAQTFGDYVDQIAKGEKSLKDVLKDMVISQLEALQKSALAELVKGIATAWAQAPATFGASLGWIGPLVVQKGLSIAAIQAAKSAVKGLAEGGKTTGPTFAMIGEGKDDEVVLPLNKKVYAEVGQGIAENSGSAGGFKTANIYLQLDGRTLAKALGKPLTEQIQLATGLRQ
jgi:hypothetical protein